MQQGHPFTSDIYRLKPTAEERGGLRAQGGREGKMKENTGQMSPRDALFCGWIWLLLHFIH